MSRSDGTLLILSKFASKRISGWDLWFCQNLSCETQKTRLNAYLNSKDLRDFGAVNGCTYLHVSPEIHW